MDHTKGTQEVIVHRMRIMVCVFRGIGTGIIEQNIGKYRAALDLYEACKLVDNFFKSGNPQGITGAEMKKAIAIALAKAEVTKWN